jgi:hypothetical protein
MGKLNSGMPIRNLFWLIEKAPERSSTTRSALARSAASLVPRRAIAARIEPRAYLASVASN